MYMQTHDVNTLHLRNRIYRPLLISFAKMGSESLQNNRADIPPSTQFRQHGSVLVCMQNSIIWFWVACY